MTFVETKLFTELVLAISQTTNTPRCSSSWWGIPKRGTSFLPPAAFGSFGGASLGVANEWPPRDLFLRRRNDEVWMLTLYAKNLADSIPAKVLKKIKEAIDGEG